MVIKTRDLENISLNSKVDLLACSCFWPKYLIYMIQFIVKLKTTVTTAATLTNTSLPQKSPGSSPSRSPALIMYAIHVV